LRDFFFPLVRAPIGKIDEHASAANPAAATGARQIPQSVGCFTDAGRRGWHPPHASGQVLDQAADASTAERNLAKRDLVTRRAAMKTLVVRLVAMLALALAATTAAFAQSRPPSCIPQYDASGAQIAPYCGP
jgi:hypothetical protein